MKKTLIWLAIGFTVLAIMTWDRNRPIDGPGLRMEVPAGKMKLVVEHVDDTVLFKGTGADAADLTTRWGHPRVLSVSFVMDTDTGEGSAHLVIDPDAQAPDIDVNLETLLSDPHILENVQLEVKRDGKISWSGRMGNLEDFAKAIDPIPELKVVGGDLYFDEKNKLDHGLYRFTVE